MSASFSQALILFMLMATGFAAARLRVLTEEAVKSLSRFVVSFALPALILISMQKPYSPALRDQAFRVLFASAVVYALSIPLAFAVSAFYRGADRKELGAHRFAMCFSNVGFMGFPIMAALFGKDSLFTVSVYNIPFQLLAFSVGIAIVSGNYDAEEPRKPFFRRALGLVNPAIVAALAGFIFFLLSVTIPEPLYSAVDLLGGTTTPLSMVLIGAILARSNMRRIVGNPRAWITSAYRLVAHPLLVWCALFLAGFRGLDLAVPVVISAMPAAANTALLAAVYGGDADTASGLTFLTTMLSLVTIPFLANFLFGV